MSKSFPSEFITNEGEVRIIITELHPLKIYPLSINIYGSCVSSLADESHKYLVVVSFYCKTSRVCLDLKHVISYRILGEWNRV